MVLLELFNKPADFEMSVRTAHHARYMFQIDDLDYFADFNSMDGLWVFNFFQKQEGRDMITRFTGGTPFLTGNVGVKSVAVFSTVVAILHDFEEKYHPRALFIAADSSETGRAPLYRRLIRSLLPGGWQAYTTIITRNQDPLRQEREGYILTHGEPIDQAARPLRRFGITPQQWRPFGEPR